MSRRTERMAEDAARQASEAAKVLQQRGQEAKQEKVEPEQKPEVVAPRLTPKMDNFEAHKEINKRYLQTLGVNEDGSPIEPPKKAETEAAQAETPSPPPQSEPAVSEPPAQVTPEMVKVKVDGEEFDVSKAEVEEAGGVKAYQIQRASENRLKKANEAVAEARRMQDTVARLALQQYQQRNPQQPQITADQFIAQKLDAIRYGTPEEGSRALSEILGRVVPKIDQNALLQQATTQAMAHMRQQAGVDLYKEKYADIVSNQHLLKLSVLLENERLAQVPPQQRATMDWTKFYTELGNEVRAIVGRPNQPATTTQPTQGTTSQPSAKEERKASITVLPTASARAEVKVEKELTPEEDRKRTIQQMQAANLKLRGEKLA